MSSADRHSANIDELRAVCERLRTQDNRITSDPLFVVQQKRRVYGMDTAWCDGRVWYHPELDSEWNLCSDDEIQERIRESLYEGFDPDAESVPEEEREPEDHGWEQIGVFEYWDFVTAHLTEHAANQYIAQNRHNLTEPRVYVTSQYRCDEWNMVVRALPFLLDERKRAEDAEQDFERLRSVAIDVVTETAQRMYDEGKRIGREKHRAREQKLEEALANLLVGIFPFLDRIEVDCSDDHHSLQILCGKTIEEAKAALGAAAPARTRPEDSPG